MTQGTPGHGAASAARVVETHISILIFVGERVYKLRKPVRFDFLDFTDRAVRQADCRREVELNRRLAPDVYLGVADVVMDGEPLDHMVVMRALPEERKLGTLLLGGAGAERCVDEVATAVWAFHAGARRSPAISATATAAALGLEWEANFEEVARFVGSVLDPAAEREIQAQVSGWLGRHAALLDERIAQGWVCDGHGDLQAEDIFCLDDGVRILDCIEFSDQLRFGDVCADVAFLAMDLERLGRPDEAERFIRHYEAHAGRDLPPELLHQYVAQRAYVRAKVACLRAEQGATDATAPARRLHALAAAHLRRAGPPLVLVGGLPGTGKSTLAEGLAAQTGWVLLRSDTVRRELVPPAAGSPAVHYTPEAVGAVYAELLGRARRHLGEGVPVVADASWVDARQRGAARGVAAAAGGELVELCCACGEEVAVRRIRARLAEQTDASEATPEVRALLSSRMDPWPGAATVDTSGDDPSTALAAALAVLGA